ncbi:Rab GTPase-activating protein 1 [Portunus trituberculatus]|uniref:Rab GTPase-activating protein 1 n=1 Tax=Portunus trituberculatus TaxID=210409 RepID=A0A5B7CL75_PORTR|nr:Rab GTPase-activating protein 1 [Portunus trituberculatus]
MVKGSMEECSSVRSTDSAGTSEEYEIVESEPVTASTPQQDHPLEPTLNIANNGNMEDLRLELTEVMREKSSDGSSPPTTNGRSAARRGDDEEEEEDDLPVFPSPPPLETQVSQVSQMSQVSQASSQSEGPGRPDDRTLGENNPSFSHQTASDDDMERVHAEDGSGDYTIFNRVTYLGAASINAPRSEGEIQRNMAILNAQAQEQALEVSVSVPSNSEGYVIVYDANNSTEMTRFKIHRILFCARGKADTSEACCFAFTSSHGDTQETAIFQCHVFRCQIPEAVSMGSSVSDKKSYVISGHWDPCDPVFAVLNQETPKDRRVFMTVAIDLVIRGIQEPVRFTIETKVRVYPQNERFWYFSKKPLVHLFSLKLKQVDHSPQGDKQYVVTAVDNLGEVERWRPSTMSLSLNLSSLTSSTLSSLSAGRSPSIASIETPGCEEDTDDDEPLLSGSGEVSKDCPQGELDLWRQVLPRMQSDSHHQLPKGVASLVKRGVPEALRGEVWQLLAGCSQNQDMMETYRVLITKDCASDQVILRDINRTFPAHDYFKEAGGVGQDALYKISKAYAVYDEEVGYCQGLSFLAAALLLHMSKKELLSSDFEGILKYFRVSLPKKYRNEDVARQLFKLATSIKVKKIKKYEKEYLALKVGDKIPHPPPTASSLLLPLPSSHLPLPPPSSLSLLLLLLLPSPSASHLPPPLPPISLLLLLLLSSPLLSSPLLPRLSICSVNVFGLSAGCGGQRRISYSLSYLCPNSIPSMPHPAEQEALQEDPVLRLERENRRFLEDKMRLERENDDLAQELVNSKITMRKCMDQVKELLKREVEKGDVETQSKSAIIADYKNICSQLSERLDKEQAANTRTINMYKAKVASCEKCSALLSPVCGPTVEMGLEESPAVTRLQQQVRELELELAKTKLALVESECKNQDLTHQLTTAVRELQATKNTWFQKTLTSFSSLKERSGSTSYPSFTTTTTQTTTAPATTSVVTSATTSANVQRQISKDSNAEKI